MDVITQKPIDMNQLRKLYENAKNIEDINALERLIPQLTPEEIAIAHINLNDGIYAEEGVLIGEKHPED